MSNRKYRLITFLVVLLALILIPTSALENSPKLSVNYYLFKSIHGKCINLLYHNYCDYPSKGIMRGVSSILHFEFKVAYNYNPLSYLVLLVMLSILFFDLCFMIQKPCENGAD